MKTTQRRMVRVTEAMHREAGQSLVNHLVRQTVERDGMLLTWRAVAVEMVGPVIVRVEFDNGTLRSLTDDEKKLIAAQQKPATTLDPEVAEESQRIGEWLRYLKAKEADALTKIVGDDADRLVAEAQRRASTAACGVETDPNPMPCLDEEEARCEWAIGPEAPQMTKAQRMALRWEKCPRKLLQIRSAKTAVPLDSKLARGRGARIPELYLSAILRGDKPQERPALAAARSFLTDDSKKFLVLLGTNQCGKSYAAARWLFEQEGGLYVSHDDLRLAIMPGDKTGLERQAMQAQTLVLDNIESSMSPALRQRVEGLLVKFHADGKRAVLTSSMAIKDFLAAMKPPENDTGPAHARLVNGMRLGTVMIRECPEWKAA